MSAFSFVVLGEPASQGSKRAFKTKTGRVILTDASKKTKPWRQAILEAAPTIQRPLDGPLLAKVVFTMARPKSARKIDFAPCKGIDLDKAVRAVFDSITDAGLWVDDSRVVDFCRLAKVWYGFDPDALPTPGVVIACAEITGTIAGTVLLVDRLFDASIGLAFERIRGGPQHSNPEQEALPL